MKIVQLCLWEQQQTEKSETLALFKDFAQKCDYCDFGDGDESSSIQCLYPSIDACSSALCPFVRLATLVDIKKLNIKLYGELVVQFIEKLANGITEAECHPLDEGNDWVVVLNAKSR